MDMGVCRLRGSRHRVLVARARPEPVRAMRLAAAGAYPSRPSQPFTSRSWRPAPPVSSHAGHAR